MALRLQEYGVDCGARSRDEVASGSSALMLAAEANCGPLVEHLVEAQVLTTCHPSQLTWSASDKVCHVVCGQIDFKADRGQTALHAAAIGAQDPRIFQLLLDRRCDVLARTKAGHTVLHALAGSVL